jgi:adenosylmethionine-8-amino-7-oxononanoate aminotransferase
VFDVEGKRYLDGIAGIWCVNIGHGNAEMADARAEQARRLSFFNAFVNVTNPPAARSRPIAETARARIRARAVFHALDGAFPKRIWQSGSLPGQRSCLPVAILAVRLEMEGS